MKDETAVNPCDVELMIENRSLTVEHLLVGNQINFLVMISGLALFFLAFGWNVVKVDGLSVVEFAGTFPMVPYTTRAQALSEIANNIQGYKDLVISHPAQWSSLIVFPEDALYSPAFPDRDSLLPYLEELPSVGVKIKCSNESVLQMISCLSATLNCTVVVNMAELLWIGTDKSGDNRKQFNVDVVVDPSGTLLAKYRKKHLYYEPAFDSGDGEYSTYPSTFVNPADNSLYALLTCNDLTYFHDSVEPLVALGVKAIIAPAWWVNLPPLMSGNAYFSGLSLAYNTTIAVAGCGMGWYCSGSGIYSQGRALATTFNPTSTPASVLLSDGARYGTEGSAAEGSVPDALVPSSRDNNMRTDFSVSRRPPLIATDTGASNATLLRFTPQAEGEHFTHVVTSALGLRCEVSGVIGKMANPPVSLAVVSIRGLAPDLGFPQWGIEFCGVVACPADNCLSAKVIDSNVTVSGVKVAANFNLDKYRLFPILLQSGVSVITDSQAACDVIDLNGKGAMSCGNVSRNAEKVVVGTLSLSLLGMEIQQ